MKRLLVILLALAIVMPSAVGAAPPPPELPPPPPPRLVHPIGPQAMGDLIKLDLADAPKPPELLDENLVLEKRAKAQQLARSLSAEQRARMGELLAANPPPVEGKSGMAVQPSMSRESASQLIATTEALLPQLKSGKEALESGLAEILTPEQYALYQESLLPAPVPLGGVGTRSYQDCENAYVYSVYGINNAYYAYYYAYYADLYNENWVDYGTHALADNTYVDSYNGYVYAAYAYFYYYNATYALLAYAFNAYAMVGSWHLWGLGYDLYSLSGGTNTGYSQAFASYAYVYEWYAVYYGYRCYAN